VQKVAGFTLFFVLAAGAPAMAVEDCPVDDAAVENSGGYGKAVEALARSAPDCERAYQVLEVCQTGSSFDNALAAIVQSKCEPLFVDKAGSGVKKAYKKAQDRCNTIAEKNDGTMYQGLAAVCRAKASRDLARRYSK
jgi:aromatic ring-opening dioxygenase LigB subunit